MNIEIDNTTGMILSLIGFIICIIASMFMLMPVNFEITETHAGFIFGSFVFIGLVLILIGMFIDNGYVALVGAISVFIGLFSLLILAVQFDPKCEQKYSTGILNNTEYVIEMFECKKRTHLFGEFTEHYLSDDVKIIHKANFEHEFKVEE